MNSSRAIHDYSNRNPAIHLVGNVIPGSRNFPYAVSRIFVLVCTFAIITGVFNIVGGNWQELWQTKPLIGMLCLSFILGTLHIGFRDTLTGFVSAVLGSNGTKVNEQYNQNIRKWTINAAHIWALLTVFHSLPLNITNIGQNLSPAVMGYLYAVVFGLVLHSPVRNEKDKPRLLDALMPAVCLVVAYYVYQNLMK